MSFLNNKKHKKNKHSGSPRLNKIQEEDSKDDDENDPNKTQGRWTKEEHKKFV
jgi:hypothetical protein